MNGEKLSEKDQSLLTRWFQQKGLSKATQKKYTSGITRYVSYNGISLNSLLDEAENEEESGIRKNRRGIGDRIGSFKVYLEDEGRAPNTVRGYLNAVKRFYSFNELSVPDINVRGMDVVLECNYGRIPTREDILKMCRVCKSRDRAMIYTMSLSGISQAELRKLTVNDILKAAGVRTVMDLIDNPPKDLITLHVTREIVHHRYFTFLPPEATREIISYLQDRLSQGEVDISGRIFLSQRGLNLSASVVSHIFQWIGKRAGFESDGGMAWWRPHSLRKYFISTIKNKTRDVKLAEFLAGYKPETVKRAYWYPDEEDLKKRYREALPYLSLDEVKVKDIHTNEYMELSLELETLQAERAKEQKEMAMLRGQIVTMKEDFDQWREQQIALGKEPTLHIKPDSNIK